MMRCAKVPILTLLATDAPMIACCFAIFVWVYLLVDNPRWFVDCVANAP